MLCYEISEQYQQNTIACIIMLISNTTVYCNTTLDGNSSLCVEQRDREWKKEMGREGGREGARGQEKEKEGEREKGREGEKEKGRERKEREREGGGGRKSEEECVKNLIIKR